MRKIIFMLLLAMVLGGCARKETTHLIETLDACVGNDYSCVQNAKMLTGYDYSRSLYMWNDSGFEQKKNGDTEYYWQVKSYMDSSGRLHDKYAKIIVNKNNVVQSYEWNYDWNKKFIYRQ